MNQPHYNAVREAVIKAVPEIMESKPGCRMVLRGDAWHEYAVQIGERTIWNETTQKAEKLGTGYNWKILGRPIRLADVLLAIDKRYNGDQFATIASNGWFHFGNSRSLWNLRQDDLSLQSEETIEFLYQLLKP